VPQQTVSDWLTEFPKDRDFGKPPGSTAAVVWGHVQHFDVWAFQSASDDAGSPSSRPRDHRGSDRELTSSSAASSTATSSGRNRSSREADYEREFRFTQVGKPTAAEPHHEAPAPAPPPPRTPPKPRPPPRDANRLALAEIVEALDALREMGDREKRKNNDGERFLIGWPTTAAKSTASGSRAMARSAIGRDGVSGRLGTAQEAAIPTRLIGEARRAFGPS
jgi:hypothetical protein